MKPTTSAGYDRVQVTHVRRACLYLATKLGDLLDELVVVGGLVPSLIVDQTMRAERHVGTLDLDLGMALAILDEHRYEALAERLRNAGFGPDRAAAFVHGSRDEAAEADAWSAVRDLLDRLPV